MVFRMIHVKEFPILPKGKVWYLDFPGVGIVKLKVKVPQSRTKHRQQEAY